MIYCFAGIFPCLSLLLGCPGGVLSGAFLPGLDIDAFGVGDEVRGVQFSIREGFGSIPVFGFKFVLGPIECLFFVGGGFKSFFFKVAGGIAVFVAFKRAALGGDHFGFPFFVCFYGKSSCKAIHEIHGLLFAGFQARSHSALGGARTQYCGGNEEDVLNPEYVHDSIFMIVGQIANKKASPRLRRRPNGLFTVS